MVEIVRHRADHGVRHLGAAGTIEVGDRKSVMAAL
jgi:hypothetical protein